ncbi:MAG: heme-binding domain-containing protein [SAR324 cluster bacterium]|nr:heme-binding domain-containing protein [SAR324 cluster bacterium]
MKFTALWILLLTLLAPIQLFAHSGEKHSEAQTSKQTQVIVIYSKASLDKINEAYQNEVKPIFEKKCFDCHGSGKELPWYGSLPLLSKLIKRDITKAKEHLDFSQDFPFGGHGKPKEDLEALIETNSEGDMPPLRFLSMNWGAKLTDADKQTINDWAQTSLDLLQNQK